MIVYVTMPQLGETVSDGTVTRWLKGVGDKVADQEPLLEIATDKVDTEVPSPTEGTLLEILVDVDTTVVVGTHLASLEVDSVGTDVTAPVRAAQIARDSLLTGRTPPTGLADTVQIAARHRHTPLVRRLAVEAGVQLFDLVGTGPAGRVTRGDVAAAAAAAVEAEGQVNQGSDLDEGRRADDGLQSFVRRDAHESEQGERSMVGQARRDVALSASPASLAVVEVDVTTSSGHGTGSSPDEGHPKEHPWLVTVLGKAVVEALGSYPKFNAQLVEGETLVIQRQQNISIAFATSDGRKLSVVADAGDLTSLGLARRIDEAATHWPIGRRPDQSSVVATFSVTTSAEAGPLLTTGIIPIGQVAVVSAGSVVERPTVVRLSNDERVIAIRSMVYVALTYDHRVVDAAEASQFLGAIKERLELGHIDVHR